LKSNSSFSMISWWLNLLPACYMTWPVSALSDQQARDGIYHHLPAIKLT